MAKCAGKIIQSFMAETCFLQKTEYVIIKLCKKKNLFVHVAEEWEGYSKCMFFHRKKKEEKGKRQRAVLV